MTQVITLGETMALFVAQEPGPLREATTFRRHIAGAESNVAIGVARLGHTAGWIGCVGDDELGRAVLFRLRGEGVDVSHARIDREAATGVFFRERRESGPLEVVYYRRGSAGSRLAPTDLDESYLARARFLHLTGITPALSPSCREAAFRAAELARAHGVTVVLDPNFRRKLWSADEARATLRDLARRCDIMMPGIDEAELLTGHTDPEQAARDLLALGATLVVIKLGARGSVALQAGDAAPTFAPAIPVARVVDPVGAGDAFAAGFLVGRLENLDLADALALANRCGAFAITTSGDVEALPLRSEIDLVPTSDVRR